MFIIFVIVKSIVNTENNTYSVNIFNIYFDGVEYVAILLIL